VTAEEVGCPEEHTGTKAKLGAQRALEGWLIPILALFENGITGNFPYAESKTFSNMHIFLPDQNLPHFILFFPTDRDPHTTSVQASRGQGLENNLYKSFPDNFLTKEAIENEWGFDLEEYMKKYKGKKLKELPIKN
jgi:hypothetical protein